MKIWSCVCFPLALSDILTFIVQTTQDLIVGMTISLLSCFAKRAINPWLLKVVVTIRNFSSLKTTISCKWLLRLQMIYVERDIWMLTKHCYQNNFAFAGNFSKHGIPTGNFSNLDQNYESHSIKVGLAGRGRPPKWSRAEVGFTRLKVEKSKK